MPELPDVRLYIDLLRPRLIGATLQKARVRGVSLLRTFDPPIEAAEGRRIESITRLGKRIVLTFEGDLHFIIHLMIAGRFRWSDAAARPPAAPSTGGKIDQAMFTFERGTLTLTEAGTKKRASLHVVAGAPALAAHNPGGLDVFTCDAPAFATRLRSRNRTLKRALTDPSLLDGIGNAYSDEILHAARMSPTKLTGSMPDEDLNSLLTAARSTLDHWTRTLRTDFGLNADGTTKSPSDPGTFPGPGQITAFRPGFAVHGKFKEPCPDCATPVQRVLYAENECNYCPRCQTGGKLLADRALSRLLKSDWPRTIEELEGTA